MDGDGEVNLGDLLYVLLYNLDSSIVLPNNGDISRGDVNGDSLVDVADAVFLLRYLQNPSDPGLPPGIGEDRDALAEATPVNLGSSTSGSFSAGDVNYFVVEMSGPGPLTAYTTGDTDAKGYILDSAGTVLAENDDGGTGFNFRVSASVSAGTYYIKIEGAFSWTTGDYTLHLVGPLDLVVAASVSDSTLALEQPFTLRATVRNQGEGAPEPTVLFYYRSTDATITSDDTQISADVISLETSNVVTKSLSLTAPEAAGTYYYGACVQSVSGESNPDNNCSDAVRVVVSSEFVYTPPTDPTFSRIYWTDKEAGTIQRANLDGTNIETLVTGTGVFPSPFGIALDVADGKMYWTDWIQDDILRANLDGTKHRNPRHRTGLARRLWPWSWMWLAARCTGRFLPPSLMARVVSSVRT